MRHVEMTQWLDILREKHELAMQLEEKIPRFLAYDRLTLDQATRLHTFLVNHAGAMHKVVEDLGGVDLPASLHEAAAVLDTIFAGLARSAANRLGEIKREQARMMPSPDFVHG